MIHAVVVILLLKPCNPQLMIMLISTTNQRLLSLAVAVSCSPSRSFITTKLLRLVLPPLLGSRSVEEKASILSNGGVFHISKTCPSTSGNLIPLR
ncbi:hypothetical protein Bca101_057684 [Brassica carinata]